ncbi:VOC family protein [Hydrogenophaga sp. OTU3427]|uniref:VOC family protein n=1 Tax=Hydrogenophaga sp. OTU3427 TaxID=3043856 RepID=UPI00313C5754
MSARDLPQPAIRGVDHTARPTWKLRETLDFYGEKLGLPLVHVISARGWGPDTHPDFLHFFFDAGNGATIAFFYYLGTQEPAFLRGRAQGLPLPQDHVFDATHTAWLVESEEELKAWKTRLEAQGLQVSVETRHEVIESIYVRDPNGYFIEFTRKLRPLTELDHVDARRTLQAALAVEDARQQAGQQAAAIDEIWGCKARLLDERYGASPSAVSIYVPAVDEFASIVGDAAARSDCRVTNCGDYRRIDADVALEFRRRELGLRPAVWYGLFTGGLRGRITVFDRDRVVITPAN